MAIVDKSGVTGRSLATHKERLEARYKEQFGEDLSLAPYTVQAQLIGIAALWHAETDEQIVALGNMFSVETATGNQLDDIGSLVDVTRYRATHSRVTARLTGVAGTEVPAGSRARTSEFDQFETLTDAVLSPAGVDIVLQALEPGPIVVEAGDLTHIVTVIAGWETITNASASSIGVAEQSDADYRSVYQVRTAHSSVGPLDALRGAILEAGATRIPRAVSNDTPSAITEQDWHLAAHSVLAVVEGGNDADVSRAVRNHKGMGVAVMRSIRSGSPTLGDLDAISDGTITFRGVDYTGLDFTGGLTAEQKAAVLNTALATAGVVVHYEWITDAYFVAVFPWSPSLADPEFDDGVVATALGFNPDAATESPGLFSRPVTRQLVVTADVTVQPGFQSDGLAQMRTGVIERVGLYGIGEQVWSNDILASLEAVRGTRVTALSVQEGGRDISGVSVPLDALWNLTSSNLTITLSGL